MLGKAFTVSTEKEMFGHIKLLREASRLADAYAVLNQSRYEFGQVTEHLCTNHFGLHHRDMSKARVPLYRNTHCRPLVTSDQRVWDEGKLFYCQWIGLRGNLQENPIFNGKIYGFL